MRPVVLTDIEGTTSSIAFVKDVLFPYARARLPAWLGEHAHEPRVVAVLDAVRDEADAPDATVAELAAILQGWIDEDRKATPLKTLQGWMWKDGYEAGDYEAHVYPDAAVALRAWHGRGIPLHVYSSGSVAAQVLFFRHSVAGDLTPLFSGHFDTTTGPKKDTDSYRRIAEAIGTPAGDVLFLSDVEAELDAARGAGMRTAWLVREGPLPASSDHPVHRSFADITP